MFDSIDERNRAIRLLREYEGDNPYILLLKKNIIILENLKELTAFNVEYILKNIEKQQFQVNRTIKVLNWYGKILQEKWGIEFIPEKLKVISVLGETDSIFHCIIKYRQNMNPISYFLLKTGIIGNSLLLKYPECNVDFDRYDRLSTIKDPNRILKNEQKEGINFLLSRKKCILADSMGYGKTTQAVVASIEGNFDSVLIICPASIKNVWKKELMWYVAERDITVIDSHIGKNKSELEKLLGYGIGKSGKLVSELQDEFKERGKWQDNRFVIINYDILDDVYKLTRSKKAKSIQEAEDNSPMFQYLKGKKSLVIIDEAHLLSNTTSNRYKIIKSLLSKSNPDSLYLLTGTPITNNPANFYCLLALLNDPITQDYKYYMEHYCKVVHVPINAKEKDKRDNITKRFLYDCHKATWYDLSKEEKDKLQAEIERRVICRIIPKEGMNLEELRDRTSHIYLRRVTEDLKNDEGGKLLPNKYVHTRIFDLNAIQLMEYNKLWEEYETLKKAETPDKEIDKDLLEGAVYRKYLSNQMIPNTIELVDRCLKKGEKVIIGCCYDEELYTLKDYYSDNCVIYNGKMSLKEKDLAVESFMTNPDIMVFIGNIKSCGVGITLISSRVLIFNNFPYVPSDCRQTEDRIYRIGQTRDCHVYYQYFANTQYEKMWNTVMRKDLEINQIIKKESEK